MTIEFNVDSHNDILITFVTGKFDFSKMVKVIKMTLDRCREKNLPRALIDVAQLENLDIRILENYSFSRDLANEWASLVKMCIVYDHQFLAEMKEEAKEGPEGWVMMTTNKNQSVFWLLANGPSAN